MNIHQAVRPDLSRDVNLDEVDVGDDSTIHVGEVGSD